MKRFAALFFRAKAAFPAVAFFGGFLWDAATLGRAVTALDLWMLLGYLLVSAGLLVFMGRRGRLGGPEAAEAHVDKGAIPGGMAHAEGAHDQPDTAFAKARHWLREEGPVFFLQFCFGSQFSALFILYFLSSSYLPGFVLAVVLLGLLVANEFLEDHYHRFTLTWALFGTCAILFLNFAIPHVMGSINAFWFFISTAAGVGLTFVAKRLSPKAKGSLWPTYAVALCLVGLYLANAIPPVPLVKKNVSICRNLERVDGDYSAEIEPPPAWAFWRTSETLVRQRPGEKIFCFTSVFAPKGLHCTLYHRWRFDDPRRGWVDASRIGFPIAGGRAEGFRGYTNKRNLAPGKWEVRLETETGRVLGEIRFRCEASSDTALVLKRIPLD
ncbi:MAG: DUF2914 domain-containing protein [Fibrobacteres bacterium]|nr:DUF2914 domain-containing protein [Fibrobacterota bacterium]